MNVDKFGHHIYRKRKIENCCLKNTNDYNFDAENKIIKNIGNPIDIHDSVPKKYVDDIQRKLLERINELNEIVTQQTSQINVIKQQTLSIKKKENEQRNRSK